MPARSCARARSSSVRLPASCGSSRSSRHTRSCTRRRDGSIRRAAARRRVARTPHRRGPEAVDLGGRRVGTRRPARGATPLDRRAAPRTRAALGRGPEAAGARRLDRARAIVIRGVSRPGRGGSRRGMNPPQRRDHIEVAVIGAGQAGLAMGYFLRRHGRSFVILERAGDIAAAWRERWDSLTLFTPRRYSALPGLPFPGDPDGYPTRDDVVAYLERYTETLQLPVELNSEVKRLDRDDSGRFQLETDGRALTADQVVIATGPFQTPYVPSLADHLGGDVFQTHAVGYRRPADIPAGTVLVADGGNTGFQIAKELSATCRVVLAIGSRQTPLPQRLLGRDLFWWLTKARMLDKNVETRLGRRLSTRETLIGSSPRELKRRFGVELRQRVVAALGRSVRFEDGAELEVDAVLWATGYRSAYSWIQLPVFDEAGRPRHRRGITDVDGLHFLGLTWQHTRGSALIGWVKDDAEFISEQIAACQESRALPSEQAPIGAGTSVSAR